MSSPTAESIVLASTEVPLVHFSGKQRVFKGRVIVVSEVLSKTNFVDFLNYLNATFASTDQIFMMPGLESEDLPLTKMSVEQITSVVLKKQSNEVRAIVPGEGKEHFDTLHATFLSASDEDKPFLENEIRSASHRYTLEAIASNALKKFAMYWEPDLKKFILLLDNRKVFTSDKAKVKTSANKSGSRSAKALLASTPTNPSDTTPSGRPRRRIEDSKESGEDSSDDSFQPNKSDSEELEFVDLDKASRKLPPALPDIIDISSGTSVQDQKLPAPSQAPRIPKKTHKHEKSASPQQAKPKKSRKQAPEQPPEVKVKKEPKPRQTSKKHAKQLFSSSSSEEFSSDSSDSSDSEQVLLFIYVYLPPLFFPPFNILMKR